MDGSDDLTEWLLGAARGDSEAFAALYRATSAKLYGAVLRILGDRALASDILQEVYVKVWSMRRKLRSDQGLSHDVDGDDRAQPRAGRGAKAEGRVARSGR